MNATFTAKAPLYMAWLIRDFGLHDYQAAGILGNLGRESGGFAFLREIGAAPGYGGVGVAQWTGPRARAFLAWCKRMALSWQSDAANYGYLKHDLSGEYAPVIAALRKTQTIDQASDTFERLFERAGVPALADRREWARQALSAYKAKAA